MSLSKPISVSSKSILFNYNRPLIRNQIESCLDKLYIQLQRLLTGKTVTAVNLRNAESQVHIIINNLVALVDKKPIYDIESTQLAATFYENRYGFTEDELKNSQFAECHHSPPSCLPRSILSHNQRFINNPTTYQQIRGFKTKRQLSDLSNEAGFADMLKSAEFLVAYSAMF